MPGKQRLDILLVEKGLFPSREKAKTSIMAGLIKVNNKITDKPGAVVPTDSIIDVVKTANPYVSRGGLKLKKAVDEFAINFKGKTVIDIGASTGGFTDCALQHGAVKVFAVDVGYGQLDWKLRQDKRVVTLERTNIRYLDPHLLSEPPEIATIDVSFISLTKVLPRVKDILNDNGHVIALIKPQFEAGRDKVGKKGVVRDPVIHIDVIEKVIKNAEELDFKVLNLTYSPVKGPEGNIEYLLHLKKAQDINAEDKTTLVEVKNVVKEAFDMLKS